MKTGFRRLLVLIFWLYAVQGEGAEVLKLLDTISDETAPAASQPEQPAADKEGGISYRVICSPEGEMLPECQQPPVNDSFDTAQPKQAAPESVETPAVAGAPNEESEPAGQIDQSSHAAEPVAPKKASAHKAHKKPAKKTTKKAAKKPAKVATKAEKKRKRP